MNISKISQIRVKIMGFSKIDDFLVNSSGLIISSDKTK